MAIIMGQIMGACACPTKIIATANMGIASKVNQKTIRVELSVVLRCLIKIKAYEAVKTAPSAMSAPLSGMKFCPGCTTTKTPRKPLIIACHRRTPTCSSRKKIDMIVTIMGKVN